MDRFDWLEFDEKGSKRIPNISVATALPTDGPGCYKIGRQMRNAGYFKDAAAYFQKSIGYDEHNHAAWVERIDSLVRANALAEANVVSEQALSAYRKVRALYASRALVLGHMGHFEEAQNLSQISIEPPENLWYARCVRGELHLLEDVDRRFEAVQWFDEALRVSNDRWEPALLAGWALLNAGLSTWAAAYFAESAHLNARVPISWLYLGDTFASLRLYEPAAFYYNRALELDPGNEPAKERLSRVKSRFFGLFNAFIPENLQKRWQRAEKRLGTPDRSSWIE
ncbi:MAG: hypothetical protein AMXMBFR84_18860 [Candidatus Hydrogenedentota bacterium]